MILPAQRSEARNLAMQQSDKSQIARKCFAEFIFIRERRPRRLRVAVDLREEKDEEKLSSA
jgi:hypothetical protein